MKRIFTHLYKIRVILLLFATSCSSDFLEVKTQKSHVIVETLDDIEALLDNSAIMNLTDYFKIISDGDLHFTESKITSVSELQRNLYLWKNDYDPTGKNTSPWDLPYQQIFYANIALETLIEIGEKGNMHKWEELFGRSLFYRAWAHYQLLQDFAEGYDPDNSNQVGVPIITDSSFPKEIHRASLEEVYAFILESLTEAAKLLPLNAEFKTRPSLQAAYALEARVYQNLNKFGEALVSVDKALQLNNTLLDYNSLSFSGAIPFSDYNYNTHPEVLFFTSANAPFVAVTGVQVEEELYSLYEDKDIRQKAFFNDNKLFVGTYSGNSLYHFTGMGIDELYLIKAECLVRLGKVSEGVKTLETLLKKRYENNEFEYNGDQSDSETLKWILKERCKELIRRGTRWTDLKRLNRDPSTRVNLKREYLDETYSLDANDTRYQFNIPQEEVDMSGLEPNKR